MSSMRGGKFGSFDKPAPLAKKMKSFGFIGPEGSASWAVYPHDASAVQVAEIIAREAGGQNWPLKIEGTPLEEFSFSGATEKIYNITWAPSKDINYYKGQLTQAIKAKGGRKQPSSGTQDSSDNDLVVRFTEARAAAVEAEFGQLIISCLDTMEETIDTLIAKKIELLKEKARIEATIIVLEERIDGFKQKADGIIELVDPYEKDIDKLAGDKGSQGS